MTKTLRTGILLALGTAGISGINNYIAKISVSTVKDGVVFTTLKNVVVALLLVGVILILGKVKEIRTLTRKHWFMLVSIGIIGGGVPFALYFSALQHTTASSANFLSKTLFIWVALFGLRFLKEKISWVQGIALAALFGGNLVLGGFQHIHFGISEWMILGATLLWAIENIIAKKALVDLSSTLVAGARMVIGSIILAIIVLAQGKVGIVTHLTSTQWLWTLLPAAYLLGYVLTWYSALKKAPATLVASLLVPASFITTILSYGFSHGPLTASQLWSGALFAVGVGLLVWGSSRSIQPHAQPATSRSDA